MKKTILFIANPISGTKKNINWEQLIGQHLNQDIFNWEIYFTQKRGDATQKAIKTRNQFDLIVAIGGDGTINEVAQGLVNTKNFMGIIPNGSGNGFANHLGISKNAIKSINLINNWKIKKIDTALFNDKLFLNVAGFGFDATVAKAFDNHHKRGFLSYITITIRNFFFFKPSTYTIIPDEGTPVSKKAFLLTIANGSEYGNGAKIAPEANITDGYLDVVFLAPFKKLDFINIPYRFFKGTLHHSPRYESFRVKKVTITSDDTIAQLDGEPVITNGSYTICIQPQSLNIIAP